MADAVVEGWPFWAPSDEQAVEAALDLAAVVAGDRVADLGCGDGHVLIRAAQRGARVIGVEADPDLAEHARHALAAEGLAGEVVEGDLFALPLDDLDVVFTYLSPVTLQQLVSRLETAQPGARVITVDFPIPGVHAERVEWPCHLYRLPLRRKGAGEPGWASAGALVAAPSDIESLTTLTVRAGGGPVVVTASAGLEEAASVRVGADEVPWGTEVAVDVRWAEMAAGTLVHGRLEAEGAGTLDVVTLVTPDEHGQWELDEGAVERLGHRLREGSLPRSWDALLAVAAGVA